MGYPVAPPDGSAPVGTTQPQAGKPAPRSQEGPAGKVSSSSDGSAAQNVAAQFQNLDTKAVLGARTIEFAFDGDANRIVVKVKAAESGEVVKQIPPEDYLRFLARFREMIGVLFDETA